jgi:hypothetical protein
MSLSVTFRRAARAEFIDAGSAAVEILFHTRESSNQLLKTLEEWNDYLEADEGRGGFSKENFTYARRKKPFDFPTTIDGPFFADNFVGQRRSSQVGTQSSRANHGSWFALPAGGLTNERYCFFAGAASAGEVTKPSVSV